MGEWGVDGWGTGSWGASDGGGAPTVTRAHLRFVIQDLAGNVIQNALAHIYLTGTTTPVSDMWDALNNGNPVTTLVSNSDGEIEGWLDAAKQVDIVVTDNAHAAFYPSQPATTLTFANLPAETVEVTPPANTILTDALLGIANGIALLDANGDVIGAATAADLTGVQALITALALRVTALEAGGGGGGGGGNLQVVPMGVYSASDNINWNRTIALVGDSRWTIPLVRWFSDMGSDLSTAKGAIDSATRTLFINLPSRNGGTTYTWASITAGTHDAELIAWFTALGTFVSPNILVTFVDEPDGTGNGQGQSAASYFSAFDHVKAIAAAHAPNVKLGLGLAQASGAGRGIAVWDHAAYDFIDWHPYNWNTPWLSYAAIMQRDYATMAAHAAGRPIYMTTGTVENPNDPAGPNSKRQWYINMGNTLLTAAVQYPLLAGVWVWDSGSSPDFHVDTSANSLSGFKALVAADFGTGTPPSTITPKASITKGVSAVAGTTVSATVASVIPVGHHVIVTVQGNGNPGTVTVADSGSNTYQVDRIEQNTGAAKSFTAHLSAKITTQLNLGASITATLGASESAKQISGIEVIGLNATAWKSKEAGNSATSALVDSGATAMTTGPELIVASAAMALPLPLNVSDDANGHAFIAIDSSQIGGANNRAVSSGYVIAPGAEQARGVFNSNGNSGSWVAACVTYKA